MNHDEAAGLLLDLVDGRLDERTQSVVDRHIENCAECQGWLDTQQLLKRAPAVARRDDHPSSEDLALCAVRAEEEFEPDRADLFRHLDSCPQCRHELDLVREAVRDARPSPVQLGRPTRSATGFPVWRLAAAAAFGALAIGTLLVAGLWRAEPVDGGGSTIAATGAGGSFETRSGWQTEEFSEPEIAGTRLIEADGGLIFSRTRIDDGANVTIRAGEVVAFGDGFQIGSQARVAVGGSPSDPASKNGQAENG
jgi:hypothetical protein